jgi:hypothetical protein
MYTYMQWCDSYISALPSAIIYFWTNRHFILFLPFLFFLFPFFCLIYIQHMYKKRNWIDFYCSLSMVKIDIIVQCLLSCMTFFSFSFMTRMTEDI